MESFAVGLASAWPEICLSRSDRSFRSLKRFQGGGQRVADGQLDGHGRRTEGKRPWSDERGGIALVAPELAPSALSPEPRLNSTPPRATCSFFNSG